MSNSTLSLPFLFLALLDLCLYCNCNTILQSDTDCLTDESITLTWPENTENIDSKMAMPGDNVEMVCETLNPICLEPGQRFNIREGGRTVATGLVTRLLQ